MKSLKLFLKETLNMDLYRVILIVGVFLCLGLLFYVALLKDTSKETIFVKYSETDSTITVLDYQGKVIIENLNVLKAEENEIREDAATRPVDSISQSTIRAVRKPK
jgi:hypothetical protein